METDTGSPPRAVIVGAGIVGCAAARTLAQSHDVTVLEAESIAGGATGRAAGLITVRTAYADRPAVGRYAFDAFSDYDGTHGVSFHDTPSYELRRESGDEGLDIDRAAAHYREAGIPIERLRHDDIRTELPGIDASDIEHGLRIGETGWIDPHALSMAYRQDAEAAGVEFRTNTPVTDLRVERQEGEQRIVGVDTPDDTVEAETVVLATGWRTPELLPADVDLPLRSYRTQCVVVEFPDERSFPMGWVPSADSYFRPTETPGQLLVGGGSAHEDEPETASRTADASFRRTAAELVEDLFVDGGQARLIDDWAGVDATTPDGFPIIDTPADGPAGLVLATGLHGRGIMTAPVIGPVVASLVTDEDAPVPTDRFRLDRFDDPDEEFEFVNVSA
ncbi:NAD(P)/FAD-dependent oxidoreductase [Natranaeroarchaeum sulfidigenes]|uniref:Glycine/D-amino acid oxidase (Deaminating) n=1 Tax=Natranaeroarchaeum sulfidigenes TaxID=2784880 RepID=A0A897MT12_9EURY|nr:FAD-binding oxidoreductase [Natranaeroarchaeum sulfidigenes]QSG02163.1 Glycine/D-amino acid oxidase (deaminating) [Natranaeroarchaeum sulfidigenes]